MKTTHHTPTLPLNSAGAIAPACYQIYQQTRAGTFIAGFRTESASAAVEAFLLQTPAFEGGEIRLLDRVEQRVLAFVRWKMDTTEIGISIAYRQNIFRDWGLALLACQIQKQQEMQSATERIA